MGTWIGGRRLMDGWIKQCCKCWMLFEVPMRMFCWKTRPCKRTFQQVEKGECTSQHFGPITLAPRVKQKVSHVTAPSGGRVQVDERTKRWRVKMEAITGLQTWPLWHILEQTVWKATMQLWWKKKTTRGDLDTGYIHKRGCTAGWLPV